MGLILWVWRVVCNFVFCIVVVWFWSDERLFTLYTLIERMHSFSFAPLFFFLVSFIFIVQAEYDIHDHNVPAGASESSHTNNWAVLVCASRYWFNYRVRIRCSTICILPLKDLRMTAYGEHVRNVRLSRMTFSNRVCPQRKL